MIGIIPDSPGGRSGVPEQGDMRQEPEIDLRRAEFFRGLGPDHLDRIRHLVQEASFERQKALYFEGQPAEYLWVIRSGEVRLYKSSASGRVTTLEVLTAGEMFGAVSSLDQDRYTASAEGVSAGSAWRLPRQTVLRLVAEQPALAVEILVVTSRRLREAHERLRSFATDPAPARLARALLRVSREGQARVTRRALAEASGTTVETAIRVLRRFEREGWIAGKVGVVRIVDGGALLRIAGDA
jgi:CRP/FNR family cyclic AMP-dependent transcriptional regulator